MLTMLAVRPFSGDTGVRAAIDFTAAYASSASRVRSADASFDLAVPTGLPERRHMCLRAQGVVGGNQG